MSKIGNYILGLLPSFERSRVEDNIKTIRGAMEECTIPPYESAITWFARDSFKSRDVKEFDKTFMRAVKVDRDLGKDYLSVILNSMTRTQETLQHIENNIDKYFGKDIAASGLTYARANILKYIEMVNFSQRYAGKLLLWTLNEEQIARGQKIGEPFTKAEVKWLLENRDVFLSSIRVLSIQTKAFIEMVKNIPNIIVVPEEEDVVTATVGADKVDPMRLGFLPPSINFIYGIRKLIAEWQVSRYKAAQEEKRSIEYRLLALKELAEGKSDAKLQQQIEYTEGRLKDLNFKLKKMEEDAQ